MIVLLAATWKKIVKEFNILPDDLTHSDNNSGSEISHLDTNRSTAQYSVVNFVHQMLVVYIFMIYITCYRLVKSTLIL